MAGFCGNCGTRIEDGMMACPKCGTPIAGNVSGGYAGGGYSSFSGSGGYSGGGYSQGISLISPDEQVKEKIQASYAGSFLRGNGFSKSEAICTNKRFYFKGTCFDNSRGGLTKSDQEWIVDLEDITASGFKYSSNIFMMIIAVAFALFGLFRLFDGQIGAFFVFLIIAAIFVGIFFLGKKTLYVVAFAGGVVAVDASQYGMQNAQKFNKVLRIAKETKIESMM